MKGVVSHVGHGMTRDREISFVRVDLAQAAAVVLDPFPKVAVCIVFLNGCKAMVFTVQPSCESESKVIIELFRSSRRSSCPDTAWPPTLFNYAYGAEQVGP